jgi:hypothetical protein
MCLIAYVMHAHACAPYSLLLGLHAYVAAFCYK